MAFPTCDLDLADLRNQHQHHVSNDRRGRDYDADRQPIDEIERLEMVIAGHKTNRHCAMQQLCLLKVPPGTVDANPMSGTTNEARRNSAVLHHLEGVWCCIRRRAAWGRRRVCQW